MPKKKHADTLQEFLEHKKVELNNPKIKRVNWVLRKEEWIKAINELYNKVDELIVANFKKAGYNVTTEKEEIRISEDFMGSYTTYNYIVNADSLIIHFNPISGVMIGANGRVDMILPGGRVKLILSNDNKWSIADRFSVPMTLSDFNEKNIQKVLEDYL